MYNNTLLPNFAIGNCKICESILIGMKTLLKIEIPRKHIWGSSKGSNSVNISHVIAYRLELPYGCDEKFLIKNRKL